MSQLHVVRIDITVVLGRAVMPLQQLLRLGRGATVPLDARPDTPVWILANDHPVARGEIEVGDRGISIRITGPADVHAWNTAASIPAGAA